MLSERADSRVPAVKQQRDADEFLRRWPQTRSIHQAREYLRQLGLHVAYNPPGVNPSDTIALLRSAVKSGRVMVVIERATARSGAGVSAPQPTRRSTAIEPSRLSFAEMAERGSRTSATLSDAVSAPASHSWMQSYDDVSADDLIKYIQSVIGNTAGDAGGAAATTAQGTEQTTPLGNAEAFDVGRAFKSEDSANIAARGISEADEAECYEQYERDMEECTAYRAAMGGARFMDACSQRAFMNYQQCRGY
ncbi:hypothetical protein [Trinickia sp. EG282A]|uniref:hypothetical protein n=1 Tax=Trinickia sp. EG282A TaxID=3237013 RepID=UPI0034D25CEB